MAGTISINWYILFIKISLCSEIKIHDITISEHFQDRGFDTPLLNKTLFRKLRYFLGGRVRLLLSGGAPLSPDTHSLSRTCLCLPVMQGYGLTETTACATVTS